MHIVTRRTPVQPEMTQAKLNCLEARARKHVADRLLNDHRFVACTREDARTYRLLAYLVYKKILSNV
jgi:hypothetical protein